MCRKCAIEQNWHQRFLAKRIRWGSRHSLQAQPATCAALVPCLRSSGGLPLGRPQVLPTEFVVGLGSPPDLISDPAARSAPHLGTLALSAGEHPKVVQERLGHANVSITLDVYSQVSEGLHSDAASRVVKIIFGPVRTSLANADGGGDK